MQRSETPANPLSPNPTFWSVSDLLPATEYDITDSVRIRYES